MTRIYTRTGDDGSTGLGDGSRVPKHHLRVSAYGSVDELSSVLGLAIASDLEERFAGWLREIQSDLLYLGADVCVPGDEAETQRIDAEHTARLEGKIDEVDAELEPLKSFILAGGTPPAAWLHFARTVCRRAERELNALCEGEAQAGKMNPETLRYLNRLSDLLFVMARAANDGGRADIRWPAVATS